MKAILKDKLASWLVAVKAGTKYGYMNQAGEWAIPPQFEDAHDFGDASTDYATAKSGKKWGVIDTTGRWVINPQFEVLWLPRNFCFDSSVLIQVMHENKWGFINIDGSWVIQPHFYEVEVVGFSSGFNLCGVRFHRESDEYHRWGFINRNGQWAFSSTFESIRYFDRISGLAPVRQDEKWGLINIHGQWVLQPQFFDWPKFYSGLDFIPMQNKKSPAYDHDAQWGYVNAKGEWVIKPIFQNVDYCFEESTGLARVKFKGKDGYINQAGEWVIQPKFNCSRKFQKTGFAAAMAGKSQAKFGDLYGLINVAGQWIVEPKFTSVSYFDEESGITAVEVNGKWGGIDREGNIVIQPRFKDSFNFDSFGLAKVEVGKKWGYIDKTGEWVVRPVDGLIEMKVIRKPDPKKYKDKTNVFSGLWKKWIDAILKNTSTNSDGFVLIDGISDEDVKKYESDDFVFPAVLLDLYKIHNVSDDIFSSSFFSFGETDYLMNGGFDLLPFEKIKDEWESMLELNDYAEEGAESSDKKIKLKSAVANPKWIPFANDGQGNLLLIDMDPGPKGVLGQVINFEVESECSVVSKSLEKLLKEEIKFIKAGDREF
jgi:cell wall assembly regulator SMI1